MIIKRENLRTRQSHKARAGQGRRRSIEERARGGGEEKLQGEIPFLPPSSLTESPRDAVNTVRHYVRRACIIYICFFFSRLPHGDKIPVFSTTISSVRTPLFLPFLRVIRNKKSLRFAALLWYDDIAFFYYFFYFK